MSQHHSSHTSHDPSRRKFLADSAALTGTALASTLASGRSVHAAGSDMIKIGLIGCGGRGAGAVASALTVNPNAKLVALADAFADRQERALKALDARFKGQVAVDKEHLFSGFDGYRKLLRSGVDVAILAETPHFRPMHLEACVEEGVHVFAEKPMAVDAPGVRRVLAAGEKARAKNLSYVSGFEGRYSDAAREMIRRLRDGAIGQILAIDGAYNTGFLWHRGREPEWTEMEYQMRNWYYFTWLSGDHIVEQYVHLCNLAGWIMNDEPPLHAWGYGGRQVRTEPKWGDIFDHHAVVYDYPTGERLYAFTRQQNGCYNNVSSLVLGTKGRAMTRGRQWAIDTLDGKPVWESKFEAVAEHNTFREMFAGMQSGKPINDSLSMARSTMLAILGRMATHSGQLVTWDQAFASNRVLAPESYAWDAKPPVVPDEQGKYPVPIPGTTQVL